MIPEKLLVAFNVQRIKYEKGKIIIKENNTPRYYFQIISGEIKMFNLNSDGKEFVQGIFSKNQSFGEPLLFLERSYPASAVALTDVELFCLPKDDLNPNYALEIYSTLFFFKFMYVLIFYASK